MHRLLPALLFVFLPFAVSAHDLAVADNPPPLRSPDAYVSNVERAVFHGAVDEVRTILQTEATGVLAYTQPTERIPAVVGTTPITGSFPNEGAIRRVNLDGGAYAVERVLISTQDTFAYQVWGFTARGTWALDHIRGEFRYIDRGDGSTEVIWTYAIAPRVFFARPFLRRFLDQDFAPFMQSGLQGAAEAFNTGRAEE